MYISHTHRDSENMYRPKASPTQELPNKCTGTREHQKELQTRTYFVENWAHYVYPTLSEYLCINVPTCNKWKGYDSRIHEN